MDQQQTNVGDANRGANVGGGGGPLTNDTLIPFGAVKEHILPVAMKAGGRFTEGEVVDQIEQLWKTGKLAPGDQYSGRTTGRAEHGYR